MDILEQ